MSNTTKDDRLAVLLDSPLLARIVPHLPPETLHQLIRARGLDSCGELVTSATPAQLTSVLDIDLWRHSAPGRPHTERLDVDRFGEWLELLVSTGDSTAARTVASLDVNLVVAGLSRYIRVFDPGIFEPTDQSDDEAGDRHEAMREGDDAQSGDEARRDPGAEGFECEVGGYLVRARRGDAWDAIVALLLALETGQEACFHAVMRGCRNLSNSRPEIDGLTDLLLAPEQHLHDVTIEREHRRNKAGYVTPADARAFLEMARTPRGNRSAPKAGPANPIVRAYLRAADEAPEAPSGRVGSHPQDVPAHPTGVVDPTPDASLSTVLELLAEAGVTPSAPRALLGVPEEDARAGRLTRLRECMACVRDVDETTYFSRMRELAFLANTLLAGCSIQSRAFTPQEASDAAAAICNLGLEYWPTRWPDPSTTARPDALLLDCDLVGAFQVGWSVLHTDVGLFAAEQLLETLTGLDGIDPDMRRDLAAFRRVLAQACEARAPWCAREPSDVLATIDTTAWIGVLGLLDECPIMPAALTAVLEGHTKSVSPVAFDFISSAAQVADARAFVRKLPDLLTR